MVKTYQIENFHCNHFFLFMIFSAFMYQSVCVFGGRGAWGHLCVSECIEVRGQLAIVGLSFHHMCPEYQTYVISYVFSSCLYLLNNLIGAIITISKFMLYWYLVY